MSTDLRIETTTAPEHPRAFHVVGLMAMVAAFAFAMAWLRVVWDAWTSNPPVSRVMFAQMLLDAIQCLLPGLAVATLALFVLSWRPPRPTLCRGAREPGRLACAVASCFLVAAFLGSLSAFLVSGLTSGPWRAAMHVDRLLVDLSNSLDAWGYLVGLAVLVAWLVLGFIRGWRCEPTTIDRLGRLIGWGWVVLAPLAVALRFVILLGLLT